MNIENAFNRIDDAIVLSKILNVVPCHIFWKDKNLAFRGCNYLFAQQFGYDHTDKIIGKTDNDFPWSDDELKKKYYNDDVYVISTGNSLLNMQEEQIQADGSIKTLLVSKVPLKDDQENIVGILGSYVDISYLKATEKSLIDAKNAAESASRAKTEFLANMSHDVKTPMTGVVGIAELMMSTPGWCTPEKAAMIHASGLQVLNFFNNCLELSKLEMSAFSATAKCFSLKTLLEEIHDLFLPRAQSKHLQFIIDYDPQLPLNVFGYRDSIYRVILNLVGNALKFTETGTIHVRIFLTEKMNDENIRVTIEVNDTGVGIPEDKHQEIFEKLKRLTPSYQGKIEGSGIGLYIVDQYVKMMHGDIHVNSCVGAGSTFIVTLPLKVATSNDDNPSTFIAMPRNAEKISQQETSRVLLVEDNPLAQMVTKQILESMELNVDIAGTGEDAVLMFEPGKYDLIYMDIGLPGINGYQTTQAIRAKEKETASKIDTPIIALTGHGAIDVKTFCGEAGMQGVLSKPLSKDRAEKVWRRYVRQELIDVPGLVILS